tara:strand:- start:428 stop:1555 length:1128 start_codon:yes stop_codon:yes gene_type:complete
MIEPEEEGIGLDDISFDDVLDGGNPGGEVAEDLAVETPSAEAEELDADAEELEESEDVEEVEEEEEEEYEEDEDYEEDEEYEDDDEEEDDREAVTSTVVSSILDKLGFETEEEYDDTEEGLLAMTQDVGQQIAEDQLNNLFENFPLVQKHLEYVLNGGESRDFMQAYDPQLDYNQVSFEEDDIRSQKAILSDYFATKGHDQNFINELLTDYEDTGKLYQKAESARVALGKMQEQSRSQLVEQQKQQRAQQEEQQEEFWNGVYEAIDSTDDFAGISIPKREKSKFFDYISNPVTNDGRTQRDLDHSEAEMETKLAIDYLMFKGFDLSKLVETKARTSNAKSLRDRISRNEERVKSARGRQRRKSKQVDLDDLDLNI